MYSVEDLLISHGYKPARDAPAPREDKSERCRSRRTGPQAGQGLLNGYKDGPTAHAHSRTALGTGHVSNSEKHSSKPRGHQEYQSSSSRTPEAGFLSQPSLAWSSQPQSGRDHIYWSRGQQEGSGSLCPRDQEEVEVRRMAQAHSLPIHVRESPWEVARRTEHVMKNALWEAELRMPTPAKWQDMTLESWKQPRKLGRQASDGDGQKRSQERFEDLYQFVHGEHMLTSQNRKKSQSLPRALSPKSLNFTEIPVPLHDGHITGVPKVPPYPPSCPPPLEPTRNLEKTSSSGPFPRPKFGKPLKTPCHGSQPQPRGEGGFQDHQHRDPRGCHPTRSKDPGHELGMLDTGLEPPVYVPPPSYRSPPQHIPNPYLEDPIPRHVSSSQSQQQQLPEKPEADCLLPSGSLAARDLYNAMPGSPPPGPPPHPYPIATHGDSIQYIPFDDPRIRHIKLAQPPEFYEEARLEDTSYNSGFIATQEPALGKRQYNDALSAPRGPILPPVNERGSAFAHSSPQWLQGQLPMASEPGGFPGQTEHHGMRGLTADVRDSKVESHASSPQPQSEGTCRTHTKLRKFETGIQSRKSSKKSNATIFCLVSVPVKSESLVPDTDTNNNDLKLGADKNHGLYQGPALEEQSLLSMSSTDLELQALMGSMAWRRTSPRQVLGESEDGQTDDPRTLHLIKPRELRASGSWPGHQYRDQQTQTSFPEDSKSSQLLPATKPGEASNAALTPTCPDDTASEVHLHAALASSDPSQKPSVPHLRGQMSLSPSRNSAFSRTSSTINQTSMPKGASGQLPSANPVPKPEVVKGESTVGQCNSTQLFGQFLLKPVSRRPWDLISQLESFNKELQEEEESHGVSSGGDSEDSEAEQPEDCADSSAKTRGHQETRREQRPAELALGEAGPPGGRLGESQSQSKEPKPGHPCARSQALGPSQEEDSRGVPVQWGHGNLSAEQKSQEALNGMCERDISPRPVSRIAPVDTQAASLFCLAEPRGSQELTKVNDALGSVELGRETPIRVDNGGDTEVLPCVLPPLADRCRGLSTPNFPSLELTLGQEQRAYKSECQGLDNTVEVLPSESLQERAERILGIEVAVESLLPGARRTEQSQLPKPGTSACSPRSSREDSQPSSASPEDPTVATDAFYGRRKCGWTESPLFVGERAPQAAVCSDVDGFPTSQATSPEPEKKKEAKPPFKSTLFHFMEKSTNVVGPEKRLRNSSNVIESSQGKLVSLPKRADSARLVRMREVNSLSQMRCLSSKSADSMEEPDPLKVIKSSAWPSEGLTSPSGKDQAWQAEYLPSVSQNENGHPEVIREKMSDQDLWCADSYDPSRVERV